MPISWAIGVTGRCIAICHGSGCPIPAASAGTVQRSARPAIRAAPRIPLSICMFPSKLRLRSSRPAGHGRSRRRRTIQGRRGAPNENCSKTTTPHPTQRRGGVVVRHMGRRGRRDSRLPAAVAGGDCPASGRTRLLDIGWRRHGPGTGEHAHRRSRPVRMAACRRLCGIARGPWRRRGPRGLAVGRRRSGRRQEHLRRLADALRDARRRQGGAMRPRPERRGRGPAERHAPRHRAQDRGREEPAAARRRAARRAAARPASASRSIRPMSAAPGSCAA